MRPPAPARVLALAQTINASCKGQSELDALLALALLMVASLEAPDAPPMTPVMHALRRPLERFISEAFGVLQQTESALN